MGIVLLPIALLLSGPVVLFGGYMEFVNKYKLQINLKGNFYVKIGVVLGAILAICVGFLLDILFVLGMIPAIIYFIVKYFHDKNRVIERSN